MSTASGPRTYPSPYTLSAWLSFKFRVTPSSPLPWPCLSFSHSPGTKNEQGTWLSSSVGLQIPFTRGFLLGPPAVEALVLALPRKGSVPGGSQSGPVLASGGSLCSRLWITRLFSSAFWVIMLCMDLDLIILLVTSPACV